MVKLASAYQEAQDWNNALGTWNKVAILLPDWAPAYYSQGYVFQNMKNNESAKTAYEKYISLVKPEEVEASKQNLAYAHLFIAHSLYETNKESAKEHINKSLQYDPANADALKLKESLK